MKRKAILLYFICVLLTLTLLSCTGASAGTEEATEKSGNVSGTDDATAYPATEKPEESGEATEIEYTDTFPSLPNLDPDFAGEYAWSGMGTEEYLMIGSDYLHAGTFYTNGGTPISTVSGASYDKSKNTLTLNNFTGGVINVNLMGNGFKIELIGDNAVDGIIAWGSMYGGSVTFTGSGSIKINEKLTNDTGLMLDCRDSLSCLMIDREATVEVFGQSAIVIHRTMLDTAIYALQPVKMTGGTYSTGEFVEYTVNVTDENGIPVKGEDGNYITKIMTVKDIAKNKGIDLYDYSVVGDDGKPSNHVLFKPEK